MQHSKAQGRSQRRILPIRASDIAGLFLDGLCELSLRDPLTGLNNRRHFRSVLERSIDIVARSGESVFAMKGLTLKWALA